MENSRWIRRAVLTGDIINSSRLSPDALAAVRQGLAETVANFRVLWPDVVIGELDFFRGDSWQLLLVDPKQSLRLALLLRARLRAVARVDTRIAIGIGYTRNIEPQKISLSTGEAFTVSGRALDEMGTYFQLTGATAEGMGAIEDWVPLTFQLCGAIMRTWTRRQSEIVAQALIMKQPEHEEIANVLEPAVAKQTVTKALQSANWRALTGALRAFEKADWNALFMVEAKQPESAV